LDAIHFRQRAARARELAQSGDDVRLSRMLLEVALDLDAEADAMETGDHGPGHEFARTCRPEVRAAVLHMIGRSTDPRPVRIINLSIGGAKFRADHAVTPGSRVVLELPDSDLRLDGTIMRARGPDTAMVFDAASSADPGLSRLLHAECAGDRATA